jgi:hypothetical protein
MLSMCVSRTLNVISPVMHRRHADAYTSALPVTVLLLLPADRRGLVVFVFFFPSKALEAMLAPLRTRTQALPRWRQVEDPDESSLQQADHEKRSSKQDEVLSFGAGLFAGFVFSVMMV